MGLTYLQIKISNPAYPKKTVTVKLLIDSGAVYSVVPAISLRHLGIEPHSKKAFTLANGETIERDLGDALFHHDDHRASSPVIFGKPGDNTLLGIVTLEALGMVLAPLRRELKPLPMLLA